MNIETIVAWVQMAVWVVLAIAFIKKVNRKQVMDVFFSNKILVPAVMLGFILSTFSLYLNYATPGEKCLGWQSNKIETIYGRSYEKERVEVDGKRFDHCHFKDVTFVYHGLAPHEFLAATTEGDFAVETDNTPAESFHKMLETIEHSPGIAGVEVYKKDEHGNLTIIK